MQCSLNVTILILCKNNFLLKNLFVKVLKLFIIIYILILYKWCISVEGEGNKGM